MSIGNTIAPFTQQLAEHNLEFLRW